MKVRKAKKSASDKRWAKQVARKDAEIDDLKTQLDKALALVNEQAQQIKTLTERVAQLENELAKAKKDSSNSSKPPSGDIVNPKKAEKRVLTPFPVCERLVGHGRQAVHALPHAFLINLINLSVSEAAKHE